LSKNCTQHFLCHEIEALRYQLHVKGGVYVRKLCLLEAHKQSHKDTEGKEWITLKSWDVCLTTWWTIHGILKATFYTFKHMSKEGMEAEGHGNFGLKKPRMQTMQATTTLQALIVGQMDKMPYKTKTLASGEKVLAMVLPSAFHWSKQLPKINEANATFDLPPISSSRLSNIQRAFFLEYLAKARGDSFARCGLCDTYKRLKAACTLFSDV